MPHSVIAGGNRKFGQRAFFSPGAVQLCAPVPPLSPKRSTSLLAEPLVRPVNSG